MNYDLIPVVENPRRRKRLTRKQRLAGFGGKSAQTAARRGTGSRRKRRTTTKRRYRRRSNPGLATVANRRYRRRRNPAAPYSLKPVAIIKHAAALAAGIFAARYSPNLIAMVWPAVPRTGIYGYLVKAGGVVVLSYGIKMVTRDRKLQYSILAGGVASILYDLAAEQLLPRIGLTGVYRPLTTQQVRSIGIDGFKKTGRFGIGQSSYLVDRAVAV